VPRLYPFKYYGSKYRALSFILDNLPESECYVEPFAGTGIVLLNRDASPHETLNDLNGEITNFFRVLRDSPEELISQLERTPHSRREYEDAIDARGDKSLTDIERARCFFVRTQQARYGRRGDVQTKGEWARSTTQHSNEKPMKVSGLLNKIDGLSDVAERLRSVQIESRDACDLISTFDDGTVLFYCDPPYVHDSRSGGNAYGSFEMEDDEHVRFCETIDAVDGDVAVSGYQNELYQQHLDGWYVTTRESTTNQNGSTGLSSDNSTTKEVLWTNYDPSSV